MTTSKLGNSDCEPSGPPPHVFGNWPENWLAGRHGLQTDLLLSYRKAKADIFQDSYLSHEALATFEEDLCSNLEQLASRIRSVKQDIALKRRQLHGGGEAIGLDELVGAVQTDCDWIRGIVGVPSYTLKKIETWTEESSDGCAALKGVKVHHFSTRRLSEQRSEEWNAKRANPGSQPDGKDREVVLRAVCPGTVDLHVLSALWVLRVGSKLDAELSPSVYSNRVRRSFDKKRVNQFAVGSLEPYLFKYRAWKNDGVSAVERILEEKKDALFISADFSDYFHNIDPEFLLSDGWLSQWGDSLFAGDEGNLNFAIHLLLVKALCAWDEILRADLGDKDAVGGLPVGVTASKVIGNVALMELDEAVVEGIKPRFYGRYVDDIALVIEGHHDIQNLSSLGEWIRHRLRTRTHCGSGPDKENVVLKLPACSEDLESPDNQGEAEAAIYVEVPNRAKSTFRINTEKVSMIHAEGRYGKSAVEHVRRTMEENTSEWRNLPVLPEDPTELASELITLMTLTPAGEEEVLGLEKLATKRAGLALKIKDLETIGRNVNSSSWKEHRRQFVIAFLEHTMRPRMFSDFYRYYPRLFRLALDTGDTQQAQRIAHELVSLVKWIDDVSTAVTVSGYKEIDSETRAKVMASWMQLLHDEYFDEIVRTPSSLCSAIQKRALIQTFGELDSGNHSASRAWLVSGIQQTSHLESLADDTFDRLFAMDLASVPFRQTLVPREMDQYSTGNPQQFAIRHFAFLWGRKPKAGHLEMLDRLIGESSWKLLELLDRRDARYNLESLQREIDKQRRIEAEGGCQETDVIAVRGLIFPTRPMNTAELFAWTGVADPSGAAWSETGIRLRHVQDWFLLARGFSERADVFPDSPDSDKNRLKRLQLAVMGELDAPPGLPWGSRKGVDVWLPVSKNWDQSKVRVAVGALYTSETCITKSLQKNPDLSLKRWNRTAELMNSVLRGDETDYFVLHEVALPPTWFLTAALHLSRRRINLISGVEYLHGQSETVHNQVWLAAVHTGFKFPSVALYTQDKQRPAHPEADNLQHVGGLKLQPKNSWKGRAKPPKIAHGNFIFAMLVCSELTNSAYRNSLRGAIDALFVVEWNKDLNTFNSLVEASALDIHCFVIQDNNRKYGDSRIRVPAKKNHERDMVQIRGGTNEHFVIGELKIKELREFQKLLSSDEEAFKPLPDGFELAPNRRT